MKKKIIVMVVAVLVFLSIAGAVGIYCLSDHNLKLDIDKDLAIYDTETEEVIGMTHFTLKGEINGGEKDVMYDASYSDLKLNIKGDILSEINYSEGSLGGFIPDEDYIWIFISNPSFKTDDGGSMFPFIECSICVQIDRNNSDNFLVWLSSWENEGENKVQETINKDGVELTWWENEEKNHYILVEAENTSEAREIIANLSNYKVN
ncbi:MAG: hypothetical protein K2M73_07055 [Lachnospiraceae bacterium]|nr:hypothetical protein [Lachnospiraceae bacterium]